MSASEATPPNPSADAVISPLEALGSSLRQAREARGLSSSSLAGQLRMGEEQLQALESGDRERLPEMVFVIAQARRVATALDCDITALIAPLKQEKTTPKAAPPPLSQPQRPSRDRRAGRITAQSYTKQPARSSHKPSGRWLGTLALLAGLIALGSWGWQQRSNLMLKALPAPAKTKPTAAKPKPAAVAVAAKPKAAATSITLKATQATWLEVRTGAGKQLFEGTFKGERRFPLAGGLQLLAGRPDLLLVSQGDAPAKPLGRIDQIRWVTFKAPAR